jgi:hypothetical protein
LELCRHRESPSARQCGRCKCDLRAGPLIVDLTPD